MKCKLLLSSYILAEFFYKCLATLRTTNNAVLYHTSSSPWGLQRTCIDCEIEDLRLGSIEDKFRARQTKTAFREVEQRLTRQKVPQTELEFLESSHYLSKSIR